MSLNFLLDQVLKIAKKTGHELGSKANANHSGNPMSSAFNPVKTGAAVSALAALFGKKRGSTGTLAKAGSVAALGALAYQAYKAYSANQATASTPAESQFSHDGKGDAEQSSRVILRAMIAAALADGVIDEQERALIISEKDDAATQKWLEEEMTRPASVADIAREVGDNKALAAETYLAARMVCGDLVRKEIVFLAQLSDALNLDDKLVDLLEKQVGLASS